MKLTGDLLTGPPPWFRTYNTITTWEDAFKDPLTKMRRLQLRRGDAAFANSHQSERGGEKDDSMEQSWADRTKTKPPVTMKPGITVVYWL
ncbi:hypothetical protein INR49_019715 [Caranx melampygus]|nr:hypothetical protein INR49_019715 [Caranx melampygus]